LVIKGKRGTGLQTIPGQQGVPKMEQIRLGSPIHSQDASQLQTPLAAQTVVPAAQQTGSPCVFLQQVVVQPGPGVPLTGV
jgi:hypothetical protein